MAEQRKHEYEPTLGSTDAARACRGDPTLPGYVATHETIIRVLRAYEQQTITAAQAIEQLEEEAASEVDLGLVGLYRQTIERLREH
jgi:hypothetical protein